MSKLAALMIVAPLGTLLLGYQAAPRGDEPVRIGVVDLNVVFEGHPRKETLESELGQLRTQLEARIAAIEVNVKEAQGELELLEKGTTRYRDLERQLLRYRQDISYETKQAAEDFAQRKRNFHESLLEEILKAIGEYGAEEGYAAILQREFTVSADSLSWRSVLYTSPATDVTERILARLR